MNLHGLLVSTSIDIFGRHLAVNLSGWGVLIVIANTIAYAILLWDIPKRNTPPPFAAWLLWFLLDTIAFGADLTKPNNPEINIQFGTYTIGTVVVCASIIRYAGFQWNIWWDSLTAICVGIATYFWLQLGDARLGTMCALIGLTISTLPFVIHIIKGADESATVWWCFLSGSIFTIIDGNWLGGIWCGTVQTGIIILIWWKHPSRVTV